MVEGIWLFKYFLYILKYASSRVSLKRWILNNGPFTLFASNFCFTTSSLLEFVASSMAVFSYSSNEWVINSGNSRAHNKLDATLLEKVAPLSVSKGKPTHRASLAVV